MATGAIAPGNGRRGLRANPVISASLWRSEPGFGVRVGRREGVREWRWGEV